MVFYYIKKAVYKVRYIIYLLVIGIFLISISFFIYSRSDVMHSYYEKSQMLDSYDSLWNDLKINWVYYDVAKNNNIDLNKIRKYYRRKIFLRSSDKNYFNCLKKMGEEISSYKCLGKLELMDVYYYNIVLNNDKVNNDKLFTTYLSSVSYNDAVGYISSRAKRDYNDINYNVVKKCKNIDDATKFFNDLIQLELIKENEIAKIKINGMYVNQYDEIIKSVFKKEFNNMFKKISNYKHVIFDLSGCKGELPYLWENYLVKNNIQKPINYDLCYLLNNNNINKKYFGKLYKNIDTIEKDEVYNKTLSTYEVDKELIKKEIEKYDYYFKRYNTFIPNKGSNINISKVKKWIIYDKNTSGEANNFINFAQKSGFASVIGPKRGKLLCLDGSVLLKLSDINTSFVCENVISLDDVVNEITPEDSTKSDINVYFNKCIDNIKNSNN